MKLTSDDTCTSYVVGSVSNFVSNSFQE